MTLKVGQTVDGYELIDVLDSSSERVAFRVRNVATGNLEELQVLPESLQKDPERAERFLREIRILASLSHLNIVTCRGAVQLAGQWALTTDLLEGVTLAERLELGPLSVLEAIDMFRQLLCAVDCAHSHGIVHREISTSNVVVTPDKLAKLTGFTYAKSSDDIALTKIGAFIGDVEFMPPEQVQGIGGLDTRGDIYSLGALFFAMLTGRPPFHSQSQFEILLAHVEQTPPLPSSLNPEVPPALDALLLRALAKKPGDRFQTARQFLDELEMAAAAIAREEKERAAAPQVPAAAPSPAELLPEPSWLVPAALFSVLSLILIALAVVLMRSRS